MSGLVLVVGIIAGVTLSGLLACTIVNNELKVWPTPGKGSWQSRVFWSLFRTLNVATLALAFLDWRSWDGFSLQRGIGGSLAIVCFVFYGWACYALGRRNLYCGRDGLVMGGIYSWTRNPQYATAIPAYLGLAVASELDRSFCNRIAAHFYLRPDGFRGRALAGNRLWRRLPALSS